MRVAIVATDNIVVVDGVFCRSDCSALVMEGKSAVQWYGANGEVEFTDHAKPNEAITDFSPYQSYVDAWQAQAAKAKIVPALDSISTGETINQILGA